MAPLYGQRGTRAAGVPPFQARALLGARATGKVKGGNLVICENDI